MFQIGSNVYINKYKEPKQNLLKRMDDTMINLNNIKSLEDLQNQIEFEPAMEEVLSTEDLAITQMILDTLDEIEELQDQQDMMELEKLLSSLDDMKQDEQDEQTELEQELLEHELKVALLEIEELVKPNDDECGINGIQEYFRIDNGCQIEFDDDMDEYDRRNIQRFLNTRLDK